MKSKQILTWIFSIFSLLLLAACTPSREQIAATMAVQTIEARVTGTAEIEQAVSRALTQAAPTLTPTPSATLTPTATNTPIPPTPTPIATLPVALANYLENARVLRVSTADREFVGDDINWEPYLRKEIREGRGILINFKIAKGSHLLISCSQGEWNTDSHRNFAVGFDPTHSFLVQETGQSVSFDHQGNLYTAPDKWYSLLMAIGSKGELFAIIWEKSNPDNIKKYDWEFNVGTPRTWHYSINIRNGSISLDDVTNIQFDGIRDPSLDVPVECTDPIGCVVIAPDEPLHIGYMLTTSGPTAFLGEDSKGAVEIAIDDRGGKLLGHDILLTGEDSGCSAEGGLAAAKSTVTDPTILGVIGTNCGTAAVAALPTISDAGFVMLSPSNTGPDLTLDERYWMPGYYRIVHSDLSQGIFSAEFAFNELDARTTATIHDGSPYSQQLQQMFVSRFQELGGTITYQGAINVGDTDMRSILTSVASDSPDILYFPVFEPEGPYIVAQSSEIFGLKNTILLSADSLMADSFPENSGPNVVGMYLSGPYVSGPNYDDLLDKWDAKFGSLPPSIFHAFAYDSTNILLESIETVATVESNGSLVIGRQALRDEISSIKNYDGITGTLDCRDKNFPGFGISKGDCASGESLGIFEITRAELNGSWPPQVFFSP